MHPLGHRALAAAVRWHGCPVAAERHLARQCSERAVSSVRQCLSWEGPAPAWVLLQQASEQGGHRERGRSSVEGAARFFAAVGAAGAAVIAFLPSPASWCYFEERPDGSVDRLNRWLSRAWNIPIGSNPVFHIKSVNPLLLRHLPRASEGLFDAQGSKQPAVLVPLCGKTFDLPYICEQGFSVVGVEGVARAIREFRNEQKIRIKGLKNRMVISKGSDGQWLLGERLLEEAEEFSGERQGCVFKTGSDGLGYYADFPAVWYGKVRAGSQAARQLHLIEGDMFEVDPSMVAAATFATGGQFDLVYDRSALDVIPPTAREEYVAVLSRLLRHGGRVLLVVLEYDQSQVPIDPTGRRKTPPPFSVPEEEVRRIFPATGWDVEVLERRPEKDLSEMIPSFRGLAISEVVYLIDKHHPPEEKGGSTMKYVGGAALGALGLGALGLAATRVLGSK